MALLIVGVTEDGATAFSTPLDHGADPDAVVFDQGYKALRPLDAGWKGDGPRACACGSGRWPVSRGPTRSRRGRTPA